MCRFSKIAKNDKSLHPTIQTVHAQSGGGSGGHPAGLAGGGGHPAGLGGGPAAGQGGSTDKKQHIFMGSQLCTVCTVQSFVCL